MAALSGHNQHFLVVPATAAVGDDFATLTGAEVGDVVVAIIKHDGSTFETIAEGEFEQVITVPDQIQAGTAGTLRSTLATADGVGVVVYRRAD